MRWYQDRLFPKLLDWATRPLYRDRQRLLHGARGRVLELGIGTGANLALYGDAVSEIHGLEPEAAMLALARRHAREAGIRQPLHLLQGDARRLP
ncbi:MAG TPA: SAM-dependent methyltransferase, partial [Alcanivorax sp.]|nr:SAM-dependent methyltransferase [Alcanivorax sp.]